MDSDDKKTRIMKATLRLITENGFHATPVSLIAREADVAAGTIYRYFENKESIINELYASIQGELHKATMAGIPPEVSVRDEFYLKWRNILRYFAEHPHEASFVEQFSASPFINPVLMEENTRRNAHLKVLRTRGIETGVIREIDYHTIAILMWGTVHQIRHFQSTGTAAVTEAVIDEIFEVVWAGFRRLP